MTDQRTPRNLIRIATAAGLLAVSLAAAAQPSPDTDRQGRDGKRGDRNPALHLSRELDLSSEQSAQVEAIFDNARAERESLGQDNRDAHCAHRAQVESQLQSVLTADQWIEYGNLQAERAQRRSEHQADGDGGRRGGRRGPPDCNA